MILTVAEAGSTNADLLAAARDGAAEGTWLRADVQTAGQGRLGREWRSPPGNLHASTIVRPRPGDPPVPTLALVAGVALQETMTLWAAGLLLKWPNDLLAGSAKLAGILLQGTGDAVVAGFGVNLAHHPADLGRPTTSIAALTGAAPDPGVVAETLSETFARWLGRWRSERLDAVRQAWLAHAHPRGTPLRVGERDGLFDGLDTAGALILRQADGARRVIHAGDVELG